MQRGDESPGSPIFLVNFINGPFIPEGKPARRRLFLREIKKMTIKYRSVKRFGARYGRRIKERIGKVEAELRQKHKCPYCNKLGVKRVVVGVWTCGKCGAKFSGGAYTPVRRVELSRPEA